MMTDEQQDGNVLEQPPGEQPSLVVTLHPDAYPLKWETASQMVDFFIQYAGFFFEGPTHEQVADYLEHQEVEDALAYILLELVENAMKFNTAGDIDVGLEMLENELRFVVGNQIGPDDVDRIQGIFQELHSDSPDDLLVQRIEANVANPHSLESGVGFLTIMSMYGARLGWRFSTNTHPDQVRLTVMTHYPIDQSDS